MGSFCLFGKDLWYSCTSTWRLVLKLIFLDIDGVLNSLEFQRSNPQINDMCTAHDIDRKAVDRLKKLLELTDAKIVISSSWRMIRSLDRLHCIFAKFGIEYTKIIGVTPASSKCRGDEIQQFIDKWEYGQDIESFVILDDDGDMGELYHRLVHTTYNRGLLDMHIDEAVKILATPWDPKRESAETSGEL